MNLITVGDTVGLRVAPKSRWRVTHAADTDGYYRLRSEDGVIAWAKNDGIVPAKKYTYRLIANDGEEVEFVSQHNLYGLAVMEAFGRLGLPFPSVVRIWVPELVDCGYGPYTYRIDDFIDTKIDDPAGADGTRHMVPSVTKWKNT